MLLVSELATNCVRHARSPFRVELEQQPGHIRVEVHDDVPGRPVPRAPGDHDPTGRGLQIVSALADDWGVEHRAVGKAVWFTLASDGDRGRVRQGA